MKTDLLTCSEVKHPLASLVNGWVPGRILTPHTRVPHPTVTHLKNSNGHSCRNLRSIKIKKQLECLINIESKYIIIIYIIFQTEYFN